MKKYLGCSPKYNWFIEEVDIEKLFDLIDKWHLPIPIGMTLFKRGVLTSHDLNTFFNTPLQSLRNPFHMKDMEKAVRRVYEAIIAKEKICIYGDYDVDGVTSTALIYLFLKELGANVIYYIPNRLEEGYGLNIEAIDELKIKNISLLITVDCGITAIREIEYAKTCGIDVIITDHHKPLDELPSAYSILNPMREDDEYEFKGLSGVGVAFKFIMAMRYFLSINNFFKDKIPNLKKYLDIVALGTIADVVPMVDENRIFVKHGLKILSNRDVRIGLNELKRVTGLLNTNIEVSHVGYVLAPRINAVGRLGESDRGVRLLITKNKNEARWLAEELDIENRYRQEMERRILSDSFNKIERLGLAQRFSGIVLYSDRWHPGIIGIVASRVAEKYNKPAIVISLEEGIGKGSARSIADFHLYNCLKEISDLFLKFGGHKYAVGIQLYEQNIKVLQRRFDEVVKKYRRANDQHPELMIDAIVNPKDINMDLMNWLERMKPFGQGNQEPLFCMRNVKKYQQFGFTGRDKSHLRGFIEKDRYVFEIVGYNMKEYQSYVKGYDTFDIVFTPEINQWFGDRSILLKLKDIKRV
ncbi:single-stranded-DNA-specific exonuclease RecJ [Deferribacter autotrophicus]|uniref:Single-stranded-DNA-specific exonuclease RecJ n=1 Tax=Deferribacter autotrophicus TaxID=500465 RepID=A0A5A8F6T6_9BACT|nr:single-stranded-DNA-specific exonuclease RecJ [Deferribacter autotrophicus]KAA0258979.1 single-stranded-DNA-specific exonuclease RecJ [Deferribacter autotrophicus]